jgi:hypothetical protein
MLICPMAAREQCYMQCMKKRREQERGGKVTKRERELAKIKAQISAL